MSRKGYLIAEARVHDPVAYETYKALASAAIEHYCGRYLVRGGDIEVLEGKWTDTPRLIIVEFESVEQARRFHDSPEYAAARKARAGIADMNMLVVGGIDSPV